MDALFAFVKRFERFSKNTDLVMAFAMILILLVMIVPLPAFLLDMSLTLSLTLSLLILLVSIYTKRTLDFSVFPTLLLIATLFRLSLNIASTRLILSQGHSGPTAAGNVINAFGDLVVGNNYVIGFVIFLILVIINFVVITKGSGRVAEVAARFTLDAMPGKQMSIDADLNAGLINEDEARKRRSEIEQEADFYGAMDGASKFVRGDAIAGIIITVINVVGGLLIGVFQRDLDMGTAAEYYTMLTIGDGLVSQIPALIVSTAAGTVVTRSSSSGKNVGKEMAHQLFINPRALVIVASILFFLGIIPGLPGVPFIGIAFVIGVTAWVVTRYGKEKEANDRKKALEATEQSEAENVENLLNVDLLELNVGYGLISVVDSEESGDLLERIVSIRKQFVMDMGIVVPKVHIRDDLQLEPGEYKIMIKGSEIGGGTLKPDYLLAMDPGNVISPMDGVQTKEPAFGLDAIWISKAQREEADLAGYTVVDLPTVLATHVTEVIRLHAHELLGRQEGHSLIENFRRTHPKVVDELIPNHMTLGAVVKVLQNLLKEQVSIRDLLTIFETLADEAPQTKDLDTLTESVRKKLARSITRKYTNEEGKIPVMSLSPQFEEIISGSLLQTEQGVQLVMDPTQANEMINEMARVIDAHPEFAGQPILLTSPTVRRHVRKLTERFIPQLIVISHNELTSDANVNAVGTVEMRYAG